jgi:hypothetical protein
MVVTSGVADEGFGVAEVAKVEDGVELESLELVDEPAVVELLSAPAVPEGFLFRIM